MKVEVEGEVVERGMYFFVEDLHGNRRNLQSELAEFKGLRVTVTIDDGLSTTRR